MVLVSRAFASSSPVAGSASLLTNFKMQEKDGVTYSPGASLVNETYTTPVELAKRVGTGMIKSSVSPESAEIGRASCREREKISVVAVSLKKKKTKLDGAKV